MVGNKGGYVIINKALDNVYELAKNALTSGKPILWYETNTECYYIDTATLSGTDIVLTKGAKTITIEADGDITEVGDIQPSGSEQHLYEIKVSFQDELIELVCLSTESINNLEGITDSTVITDTIWNNLIKLKDKIYDIHFRTTSDTALLSGCNILFYVDENNEINEINIWTVICYADAETQNYTSSGQESNSINIIKLEDNQGYQVSCEGNRTPRNITCKQLF